MKTLERRRQGKYEPMFSTSYGIRQPNLVYAALNAMLKKYEFKEFVEDLCRSFYTEIAPDAYFRMLIVGYLEDFKTFRAVADHCANWIPLRMFLGYGPYHKTPTHSMLSEASECLDMETHAVVFDWVLGLMRKTKLLSHKRLQDGFSIVADVAAMHVRVRKGRKKGYEAWLKELSRGSQIEEARIAMELEQERRRRN